MVFITKSNFHRIIQNMAVELDKHDLVIYKKPIFFFNNLEKQRLISHQLILKDLKACMEYYKPVKNEDTLT